MGTFTLCTSLTRASIPDSVTTVGDFAFHNCEGLTDVRIGKSVTQLGPGLGYAFDGSTNLTSVVIPATLQPRELCIRVFRESRQRHDRERRHPHRRPCLPCLSEPGQRHLPASVTTIANEAFAVCANLAGAYFKGNAPALDRAGRCVLLLQQCNGLLPAGTTGWGPTYAGRPTICFWNPQAQTTDGASGCGRTNLGSILPALQASRS